MTSAGFDSGSCLFLELLLSMLTSRVSLQELLSHSAERPERQQLKEALEAMQVCAVFVLI